MRLVVITLVLGSVATVPTTSFLTNKLTFLQSTKLDTGLLSTLAEEEGPARYVTAPVKTEEIVRTVMATGTLVPALNIEVGSVLSGQVSKLLVDFNDKVKRGQVLAELDDRSYALAVDASQAALVGSNSRSRATRPGSNARSRSLANRASASGFSGARRHQQDLARNGGARVQAQAVAARARGSRGRGRAKHAIETGCGDIRAPRGGSQSRKPVRPRLCSEG